MTLRKTAHALTLSLSLLIASWSAHAHPEECLTFTEPTTYLTDTGLVCLQQIKITDENGTFIFKAALQWLGPDQSDQFQLLSVEADPTNTINVNSPTFTAANNMLTIPKVDIPGTYGTERYTADLQLLLESGESILALTSATIYINPDYIPNETWVPYGMLDPDERRVVNLLGRALPYAKLADAVYEFSTLTVDDWTLIEQKDKNSGMQAGLYQDMESGDLVLAFRGTESCDFPCSISETAEYLLDVAADTLLTLGQTSPQFDDAVNYAQDVINRYPDQTIYITGHSLGGSLAQAIGAKFRLETFAFNSAPVPKDFIKDHGIALDDETLQQLIHVIADIHDPVSNTDEVGDFYLNANHISSLIQFDFDLKEILPLSLAELDELRFNRHSITRFVDNAASLLTIYREGW